MPYSLTDFIVSLADPTGSRRYAENPDQYMRECGLTNEQQAALRDRNQNEIRRFCAEEMTNSLHAILISRAYKERTGDAEVAGPTDVDDANADTTANNSSDTALGDDIAEFSPKYSIGPYYDFFQKKYEITKPHELTIIGTGITAANHLTSEAIAAIINADKLLYCVADVSIERKLLLLNQNAEDLYALYGDDIPRLDTYQRMVERTMDSLRKHHRVCAAYYGHPGIFVWASYKSIDLAIREGYRARMLPGISALDCLFADVGFDPSRYSCQILEATDMLVRGRRPDTTASVVILQAGCVGDLGWNSRGYDGRNIPTLTEYLVRIYGADHELIIYEAAQYSICEPKVVRISVSQLGTVRLTGITTLYIPPKELPPADEEMLGKLGLSKPTGEA